MGKVRFVNETFGENFIQKPQNFVSADFSSHFKIVKALEMFHTQSPLQKQCNTYYGPPSLPACCQSQFVFIRETRWILLGVLGPD